MCLISPFTAKEEESELLGELGQAAVPLIMRDLRMPTGGSDILRAPLSGHMAWPELEDSCVLP